MVNLLGRFWLAAAAVWRRELTHFWRERSRVLGFAATPMLFWLVVGAGFSDFTFYFPGAVLLSVMLTAMFSTMSVIEDRREGFLLAAMASPAPRCAFVAGKLAGGATMAAVQGLLFLAVLSVWQTPPPPAAALQAAALLLLCGFTLTATGFWMAWRSRTPQGFHALMNVVLMPLWMISGALFSAGQAHPWLRAAMAANPLAYQFSLLQRVLTPGASPAELPSWGASVAVTALAGLLFFALAVAAVEKNPQGGVA